MITRKRRCSDFGERFEDWRCPFRGCSVEFTLVLAYEGGLRKHFEREIHSHLASHFTVNQLEQLVNVVPR
jgi:hypothetical protein